MKREIRAIPRFEKALKRLAKHFPKIKCELAQLAQQLEADTLIGDQIPNVNYKAYKVRLANSDAQKGKVLLFEDRGTYSLYQYLFQIRANRYVSK